MRVCQVNQQCFLILYRCMFRGKCPSDKLYTLNIIITCPSLHRMYVNGSSTIFDGEIYGKYI